MSFILNIDTAIEGASVCLAEKGTAVNTKKNSSVKDSAAWLQPAIRQIINEEGIKLHQISAVAVSNGPGSYTGLRVGLATAKGLCYALNIPLITIGTLKMMAFAAIDEHADYLCPMIDARRMEVFAALYTKQLDEVVAPHNIILDESSFSKELNTWKIIFFGNASEKFQSVVQHKNATVKNILFSVEHLAALAFKAFNKNEFSDLAYTEPFYVKEFYTPAQKANS